MSWRGTLLLMLLAGLSLGFFLFSEQTKTHPPEEPLLGIDPAAANKIEIQEGGGLFALIKTNGIWMIQGNVNRKPPSSDRANPQLIAALLNEAADIEPLDILRSSDLKGKVTLLTLGLKNPDRGITIHSGEKQTLWLGVQGAAQGSLYARLNSGKTVYLIPGKIASLALHPAQDYRDPRLTDLSSDHLNEVSITKGGGIQQLQLKKDQKEGWLVVAPLSCNGDVPAITSWLDSLLGSQIKRWLPDDADPSSCGFDLPSAVVTLREAEATNPLTITIGSPTQESPVSYFVKCSDRPGICLVGGSITNTLSVTPQKLRSKKIKQIDYDTVDRIEILNDHYTPDLLSLTRKSGNDDWLLSAGSDSQTLSPEVVKSWFDQLQNLTATCFEAATGEHVNDRGLGPHSLPTVIRLIARLSENTAQEDKGETVLAEYVFGTANNNEVALREGNASDLMILPESSLDFLKTFPGVKHAPATNAASRPAF
jgi:hypothetical protein